EPRWNLAIAWRGIWRRNGLLAARKLSGAVNFLHVVVLLQRLDQTVDRRRVRVADRREDSRQPGHFRRGSLDPLRLEMPVYRLEPRRVRDNLEAFRFRPVTLRAGFQLEFHQSILVARLARDDDLPLVLQQPRSRPGSRHLR